MCYRDTFSPVDEFLDNNPHAWQAMASVLCGDSKLSGDRLIDEHLNPMIDEIYGPLSRFVDSDNLTLSAATFFIRELSVFARYNSYFLRSAAEAVSGFCPEFGHELMRNYLEEGGERGKIPAHSIMYSTALMKDLDVRVTGYMPRDPATCTLVWMHDVIVAGKCPSTILGMYYATEAVATPEIEELRRLTNRIGRLSGRGTDEELTNIHYWISLHLDSEHEASYQGQAVEAAHREGIGRFIRQHDAFNFSLPQVLDGFLQILSPLAQQWQALKIASRRMSDPDSSLVRLPVRA